MKFILLTSLLFTFINGNARNIHSLNVRGEAKFKGTTTVENILEIGTGDNKRCLRAIGNGLETSSNKECTQFGSHTVSSPLITNQLYSFYLKETLLPSNPDANGNPFYDSDTNFMPRRLLYAKETATLNTTGSNISTVNILNKASLSPQIAGSLKGNSPFYVEYGGDIQIAITKTNTLQRNVKPICWLTNTHHIPPAGPTNDIVSYRAIPFNTGILLSNQNRYDITLNLTNFDTQAFLLNNLATTSLGFKVNLSCTFFESVIPNGVDLSSMVAKFSETIQKGADFSTVSHTDCGINQGETCTIDNFQAVNRFEGSSSSPLTVSHNFLNTEVNYFQFNPFITTGQSDWLEEDVNDSAFIKNKPYFAPFTLFYIFGGAVNTGGEATVFRDAPDLANNRGSLSVAPITNAIPYAIGFHKNSFPSATITPNNVVENEATFNLGFPVGSKITLTPHTVGTAEIICITTGVVSVVSDTYRVICDPSKSSVSFTGTVNWLQFFTVRIERTSDIRVLASNVEGLEALAGGMSIPDGAVTSSKIATGAVAEDKIQFPIYENAYSPQRQTVFEWGALSQAFDTRCDACRIPAGTLVRYLDQLYTVKTVIDGDSDLSGSTTPVITTANAPALHTASNFFDPVRFPHIQAGQVTIAGFNYNVLRYGGDGSGDYQIFDILINSGRNDLALLLSGESGIQFVEATSSSGRIDPSTPSSYTVRVPLIRKNPWRLGGGIVSPSSLSGTVNEGEAIVRTGSTFSSMPLRNEADYAPFGYNEMSPSSVVMQSVTTAGTYTGSYASMFPSASTFRRYNLPYVWRRVSSNTGNYAVIYNTNWVQNATYSLNVSSLAFADFGTCELIAITDSGNYITETNGVATGGFSNNNASLYLPAVENRFRITQLNGSNSIIGFGGVVLFRWTHASSNGIVGFAVRSSRNFGSGHRCGYELQTGTSYSMMVQRVN